MAIGDLIITDTKLGVGTTDNLSTLTVRAPASFDLSGTVDTTSGSATMSGTLTKFQSELAVGDRVGIGPDTRTVAAIASDTSATVDVPFDLTATAQTVLAMPSMARFDDGTSTPQIVVNDQGNIGIGTLSPNGALDIATGGAGEWNGCPVILRLHTPEGSDSPWGVVMTNDATGPDTGAAIWLDCDAMPGGSVLRFTLTDDNGNPNDTFFVDGTSAYLGGGFLAVPGCLSENYVLTGADYYVFVDAGTTGQTVTLPMIIPFHIGRVYYIFKTSGTGPVTIVPSPDDLAPINGVEGNITIGTMWDGFKLIASLDGWVAVRLQFGNTIEPASVAADRAISPTDQYLYVDAGADGHTLTLPVLADNLGRVFHVFKSAGAGAVTIAPNGTDKINGVNASKTISNPFDGVKLVAGTTDTWFATALPAL